MWDSAWLGASAKPAGIQHTNSRHTDVRVVPSHSTDSERASTYCTMLPHSMQSERSSRSERQSSSRNVATRVSCGRSHNLSSASVSAGTRFAACSACCAFSSASTRSCVAAWITLPLSTLTAAEQRSSPQQQPAASNPDAHCASRAPPLQPRSPLPSGPAPFRPLRGRGRCWCLLSAASTERDRSRKLPRTRRWRNLALVQVAGQEAG